MQLKSTIDSANLINVGLLGYGLGGRVFHASLISAEPRLKLAAVASSRRDEILKRYPHVAVHDSAERLIADPTIELIVVATPDTTHAPLARAALEAGKHVVVDKPIAMNAAEARALVALARERKRVLSVFHNRRWDGDFRTARAVAQSGRLGDIKFAALCWDRFRPVLAQGWREQSRDPWGAVLNLGPHLVDQALLLFGRPVSITGDIATQRSGGLSPDYFSMTLHYGSGRVLLSASTLVADPRPRFALHGSRGSFVKHGIDPQENSLRAGVSVDAPGFGEDLEELYGLLTAEGAAPERIRTERGDWRPFYAGVAAAIAEGVAPPVDPADAAEGLELIELARRSADEQRTLEVEGVGRK
jgi:scyllo-inositol 2-dehydrogenase (NADP+)